MEEKKTTTPKKTTPKKETKPKTTPKSAPKKEMAISDIPPELLQQILSLAKQTENIVVENENATEKVEFTKADLLKIKDEEIIVKSLFQGRCAFLSPRTNLEYIWSEKGEVQPMLISEVLNMNNFSKRYFEVDCWLEPLDDRVKSALGIANKYEIIEQVQDTDALITMNIDKIKELVGQLSTEFKKSLGGELYNKVRNEELRDIVVIKTFEELLGMSLRD